jgi:hypothetical protein
MPFRLAVKGKQMKRFFAVQIVTAIPLPKSRLLGKNS